jgi:pimeloyl-ACP methyl ester carboxylesterase
MNSDTSTTRFAPTAEGRIAYSRAGDPAARVAIVCSPSLGDTRAEFRRVVPALALDALVLSADLRGHGESDASFRRYDAEALADDTIAVMDHAGVERAVLVGCSVSGGAAIVAAARHPERVAGLVLLAPFSRKIRGEAALGWLMQLVFSGPWAPALWAAYYRSLHKKSPPADLEAHIDGLRVMLRDPARRRALGATIRGSKAPVEAARARVKAPTEVIMGSADPDFGDPRAEAEALVAAIGPHAKSTVLDGLGHYPHVEDPDAVVARVRAMLAALDEPSVAMRS